MQLHSSEYRRPGQLLDGPVLVVGASHSGTDIAYELAATRPTTLVGRDCGEIPLRLDSPLTPFVFPILVFAWRHLVTRRTPMGRKEMAATRFHGGPMLRVKRADLAERGVVRHQSRVVGVSGDSHSWPTGRPWHTANVIWATGFRQAFGWIDLPILAPTAGRASTGGWPTMWLGCTSAGCRSSTRSPRCAGRRWPGRRAHRTTHRRARAPW